MGMAAGGVSKQKVATVIVAADGTGDATDIQTGINLLPTGGGVVYIKEGTYTITAEITSTDDNINLIGAGRATKIITTADITMIKFEGDYCLVENMYLYGAGAGKEDNFGFYLSGSANSTVRNCWVENTGTCGIAVVGVSSRSVVTGNFIKTCGFAGPAVSAGINLSGNCICIGNMVEDARGYGITSADECIINGNIIYNSSNVAIRLFRCDNCVVSNNHIESCGSGTNSGILVDYDGSNNIISGNLLLDNSGRDIDIDDTDCTDNIIIGNMFKKDTGTTIEDSGTGTQIAHNIE